MSARLSLRLPDSLGELVSNRAESEGVSQNQLVVGLLSSALGWRPPRDDSPSKLQLKFFHALCDEEDERRKLAGGVTKKKMLTFASQRFGRQIESASDIDGWEISVLIDELKAARTSTSKRARAGSR